MVVVRVEMYGTGVSARASGDGGSGEQAGPGVEGPRQLHAAGVVGRKRAVSSSPSFPRVLDGLCTGHLSSCLNHTWKTFKYIHVFKQRMHTHRDIAASELALYPSVKYSQLTEK